MREIWSQSPFAIEAKHRDHLKEHAYVNLGLYLMDHVVDTPEDAGQIAFTDWFDLYQANTLLDYTVAEIEARVHFHKPEDPKLLDGLSDIDSTLLRLTDRQLANAQRFLGNKPAEAALTHPYSTFYLGIDPIADRLRLTELALVHPFMPESHFTFEQRAAHAQHNMVRGIITRYPTIAKPLNRG